MSENQSDAIPMEVRWKSDAVFAALLAICPTGVLLWHLGWPLTWPAVIMPVSLAVFIFGFTFSLLRLVNRILVTVVVLSIGMILAHVTMWWPFLMLNYLEGQGADRLEYSALAATFTAFTVAWYVLADTVWISLLLVALIGGAIGLRLYKLIGART